jgi:hypothetical protein
VKSSQFLAFLPHHEFPPAMAAAASLIAGLLGSVVMASPTLAAPVDDRLDRLAASTLIATNASTIRDNPLPDLGVSRAANLQDPPPIVAPEIAPEIAVPAFSAPEFSPNHADRAIQLATASDQSDPGTAAETTDLDAEQWRQTPEQMPPPEPIVEPVVRTAPLGIPTANSTPPALPTAAPISADDDLGNLTVQPIPVNDEDFGQLPTRLVPPPPPPKSKWLFVGAQVGYFGNSNSFFTTTKNGDRGIRSGINLTAQLPLGPQTYLTSAIDANLVRNFTFSQQSYDELRLRAGIWQQLSPRMSGEIGWSNQKLYAVKDGFSAIILGDRLSNENSIRLDLSRTDPIAKGLSLSSFYQLRWSLSSRPRGDRLSNTIFTSLNQKLSPTWTASFDYLLSWSHYTQVNRDEVFQLVQLRANHRFNANLSMNLFGGFSFGRSSDERPIFGLSRRDSVDYNNWSFGVTFAYAQGLF